MSKAKGERSQAYIDALEEYDRAVIAAYLASKKGLAGLDERAQAHTRKVDAEIALFKTTQAAGKEIE